MGTTVPELAQTVPGITLDILRELAASDAPGAREAAAIYARCLFLVRREETTNLLVTLFQTGDPDIQENVLDTIDAITSDIQLNPVEATQLITAVNAR